jgi:hypothetical protein
LAEEREALRRVATLVAFLEQRVAILACPHPHTANHRHPPLGSALSTPVFLGALRSLPLERVRSHQPDRLIRGSLAPARQRQAAAVLGLSGSPQLVDCCEVQVGEVLACGREALEDDVQQRHVRFGVLLDLADQL